MNQLTKNALAFVAAGVGLWLLTRGRTQQQEYSFAGKVVLITGGSRGLGLVLARQFTQRGAQVAICARDEEELNRAAADLESHGQRPLALPCDVREPEQVNQLIEQVNAQLGAVEVLINNAGIIQVGPYEAMTRADYEDALNVMFWGMYNTIDAVLPGMRQRGGGRIVNITSIGGKISVPHLLPYCVGKFAAVGYSQGLRAELAPFGIVVTTIVPGLLRTGSPRNALFKGQHELECAWFSIGDSLHGLSIPAEQAATEILQACARGEAEAVLSLPAQAAVKAQALFPELFDVLLRTAGSVLPGNVPGGTEAHLGKESESMLAPSLLTAPTEVAALQNNEVSPQER